MDDFTVSTLTDSRNEYSAMFVSKITPHVLQGIHSIFNEAVTLCKENDEDEKYLMTFQNFLGRVAKWNQDIVERESERIMKNSGCDYLEDLLTCVHVTQLKILTNMRVGQTQKKIEIAIPKLSEFIHKTYIEACRRIYKNVYLYEQGILPLQRQKNMRECELLVKDSILTVIRENMPIEHILRSYLDESVEETADEVRQEIKEELEEVKEEATPEEIEPEQTKLEATSDIKQIGGSTETSDESTINVETSVPDSISGISEERKHIVQKLDTPAISIATERIDTPPPASPIAARNLSFQDTDAIKEYNTEDRSVAVASFSPVSIQAPKTIERLEQISHQRNEQRKAEEMEDDEDGALNIMGDATLDVLDIQDLDTSIALKKENLLSDVIELR